MGDSTVTTLEGREPAAASPVAETAGTGRLRRLRAPRRPRLWFEILLIAVSYATYSLVRNAVPEQRAEVFSAGGTVFASAARPHRGVGHGQAQRDHRTVV
ncbi:hypothetical protein ACWDUE_32160, partial [Streptomyces albogriseolus]